MARSTIKKAGKPEETQALLRKFELVRHAQSSEGAVYEQFSRIANGWITATNGRLSVGIKVNELFEANVKTEEFIHAVNQTGEQIEFSVLENHKLYMRSGRFKVYIETVADEFLPTTRPDPQCAVIDDRLLTALVRCNNVATDKADNPLFQGVWLCGYSCAASDRYSIIETWHGIHLPSGLIVPKATIKAIASYEEKLTGFGYSSQSVTFYFADGTFVKSSLLEGKVPNYGAVLNQKSVQAPIPDGLFIGLRAILDRSNNGTVYFGQDKLLTHEGEKGAAYDVPGLQAGRMFNIERLLLIEKFGDSCDFYTVASGALFHGKGCRGIIARRA